MEAAESPVQATGGIKAATSVAIVGGSEHAAAVARALAREPGVSLVAICAASYEPAGRFADEAGIPLVADPLLPFGWETPPDIVLDLSEDVVTRTALESALPPNTELLGGSATDLVWEALGERRDPPKDAPVPPAEDPPSDPCPPSGADPTGPVRRLEAANEALVRQNRELEVRLAEVYFMHEFVKALVAFRRVEDVSSVVVDACAGILGADASAVYLLDKERWVLCLAQSQGRPPSAFAGEVRLSDPLFGHAFSDGSAVDEDASGVNSSWLAGARQAVSMQAAVALRASGEPIGVLALGWSAKRVLEKPEMDRVRVMADQSALSLQNALLHAELEQLSVTDRLTELFNHGYVTQRLDQELGRADRFGHPLSVVMIDIDDFKVVNDRYGHLVGDDVLKQVSELIRENLREMDVPARYGGEEFFVIVPETGAEGAISVAERIRAGVAGRAFLRDGAGREVRATVSVGVATFPMDGRSVETLIQAADEAMYRAKRAGKDRVMLSTRTQPRMEPAEEM